MGDKSPKSKLRGQKQKADAKKAAAATAKAKEPKTSQVPPQGGGKP